MPCWSVTGRPSTAFPASWTLSSPRGRGVSAAPVPRRPGHSGLGPLPAAFGTKVRISGAWAHPNVVAWIQRPRQVCPPNRRPPQRLTREDSLPRPQPDVRRRSPPPMRLWSALRLRSPPLRNACGALGLRGVCSARACSERRQLAETWPTFAAASPADLLGLAPVPWPGRTWGTGRRPGSALVQPLMDRYACHVFAYPPGVAPR
jgi:hypothetical protein